MIKVYPVQKSNVEEIMVEDKFGVKRLVRVFTTKSKNMYLGTRQTLFDTNFVFKERNRIDFSSKIDYHGNEMPHISRVLETIDKYPKHSFFDKETIIKIAKDRGLPDFDIHNKKCEAAQELFIEYGFNSMNFCQDVNEDIWVHYKAFEESKQKKSIYYALSDIEKFDFEHLYHQWTAFIRFINIDEGIESPKFFALKCINITKMYRWLSDNKKLHKVNYVADIYNDVTRELMFHVKEDENFIYNIKFDKDGYRVRKKMPKEVVNM